MRKSPSLASRGGPRHAVVQIATLATVVACTCVLAASPARALEVARVTERGYVLVDEPDAATPWSGRVPGTPQLRTFLADVTAAIRRTTDTSPAVDVLA